MEIKEGQHGFFNISLEAPGEYIASLGDIEQGRDITSTVEVLTPTGIDATVSCPGCTKVKVKNLGEGRYGVEIWYDTQLLGRIIKKVWVTNKDKELVEINLRGFVKK